MSDEPKLVTFRNVRELKLLVDDSLVLQKIEGISNREPARLEVEGGFINLGFAEDFERRKCHGIEAPRGRKFREDDDERG